MNKKRKRRESGRVNCEERDYNGRSSELRVSQSHTPYQVLAIVRWYEQAALLQSSPLPSAPLRCTAQHPRRVTHRSTGFPCTTRVIGQIRQELSETNTQIPAVLTLSPSLWTVTSHMCLSHSLSFQEMSSRSG